MPAIPTAGTVGVVVGQFAGNQAAISWVRGRWWSLTATCGRLHSWCQLLVAGPGASGLGLTCL